MHEPEKPESDPEELRVQAVAYDAAPELIE